MFGKGLYPNPENLTVEKIDELKGNAVKAYENIKYVTDLAEAVKDADLVIEAMAENPQAKIEFYEKLAGVLPEKTVIATNSSSMLPSAFAQYTGRPEKYLLLFILLTTSGEAIQLKLWAMQEQSRSTMMLLQSSQDRFRWYLF